MEREYKCIDCGETFILDTQLRAPAKRCSQCRKAHIREVNRRNREKYKRLALEKLMSKNR